MSAFGEYLRSQRERQRLSQKDVAARLGVSATTVSRWERGSEIPSPARVPQLRELLGISTVRINDLIVRGAVPPADADQLTTRINELEDRLAALEQGCAQPVTELADAFGNSITLGPSGICIESSSQVKIDGAVVDLTASIVNVNAASLTVDGIVRSDTLITNSVVASSYTPGAGNIW